MPQEQRLKHYDDNYFDKLENINIKDFLLHYKTNRNETTFYDYHKNVHYVTEASQDYIDIEMIVTAPDQEVLYIPKFWQVLKFAWVRYFAWFILFYYALHEFFLNYVVTGGVFDTVEVSELDLKKCRSWAGGKKNEKINWIF